MKTFFSHLECTSCLKRYRPTDLHTTCPACGKVLFARYDLAEARSMVKRGGLGDHRSSMWKYRELLPVFDEANILSLGEGGTPVLRLQKTGERLGLSNLWMKDEAVNPTASFKARGMSSAISKAREFGIRDVAVPSAGNAGGALAAYASSGGLKAHVFMPENTPRANVAEAEMFGADVTLVGRTISDAAAAMAEANRDKRWFDCSTLKEPYRLEGKKVIGFEIAEQLDKLPDVIVYPTGGGTGLIGMWKAFDEMEQLGWIGRTRPRMVVVQSSGCAPIVRAFLAGQRSSSSWENASTIATGLCVPKAFADYLILDVLYRSNGIAVATDDEQILADMKDLGRVEGLLVCPEGAATLSAVRALAAMGWIKPDETILTFNTASGYKYAELLEKPARQPRH